jgi:hypothetical protein
MTKKSKENDNAKGIEVSDSPELISGPGKP